MASSSGGYCRCGTDFLKDKIADLFCHIVFACAQASLLGTHSGAFSGINSKTRTQSQSFVDQSCICPSSNADSISDNA